VVAESNGETMGAESSENTSTGSRDDLNCAAKDSADFIDSESEELNKYVTIGWTSDIISDDYRVDSKYIGLACRTNQTVNFVAMDWSDSYMFAPLGVRSATLRPSEEIQDRIVLINVQVND